MDCRLLLLPTVVTRVVEDQGGLAARLVEVAVGADIPVVTQGFPLHQELQIHFLTFLLFLDQGGHLVHRVVVVVVEVVVAGPLQGGTRIWPTFVQFQTNFRYIA